MKVVVALDLALHLLIEAQKISALVAHAQAQGRTDLTDGQLAEVLHDADTARTRLVAAIEAAKPRAPAGGPAPRP